VYCNCMQCRAMVQMAGLTMLEVVATRSEKRKVQRVMDALAMLLANRPPREGDLDDERFEELAEVAAQYPRILRWVSTTVALSGMNREEALEAQAEAAARGD